MKHSQTLVKLPNSIKILERTGVHQVDSTGLHLLGEWQVDLLFFARTPQISLTVAAKCRVLT